MTDTSKYTASEGLKYEAGYNVGLADARRGVQFTLSDDDDRCWRAGYRDGFAQGEPDPWKAFCH